MSEKKGRDPRREDEPAPEGATELKAQRDAFLHTFFKRGAELTEELVRENSRLRDQIGTLEAQNAALKTHLASDRAMRDLLVKIEDLEREKKRLLSSMHEQEEITNRFTNRFVEIESELESFANVYVASFQLHASLRPAAVLRHLKELCAQLVGARSFAFYFLDEGGKRLLPIASDGIDLAKVPAITIQNGVSDPVGSVVERSFLTGVTHVAEGESPRPPAASIPLGLEGRMVGAIVVYDLLPQKRRFVTVDHELFKLLQAQAAGVLVASWQWSRGGERVPSAEALREAGA